MAHVRLGRFIVVGLMVAVGVAVQAGESESSPATVGEQASAGTDGAASGQSGHALATSDALEGAAVLPDRRPGFPERNTGTGLQPAPDLGGATGPLELDFHPSTISPDIGDTISFHLDGVGSVDNATWNFGDGGCSPFTSPVTCTPGIGTDCSVQGYAYSSGGTKTVSVTVVVDGTSYGPVSHQLTVSSAGSCGGGCTYSISPSSANAAAAGDFGSFSLTTTSSCSWSAVSQNTSWLTVVAPIGGTGSGSSSIGWSAAENTSTSARSGRIIVGGKTVTVNQAGQPTCAYTLSSYSGTYAGAGATGSVTVQTSSGCQWTATAHEGWITVTAPLGGAGIGTGMVQFDLDDNPWQSQRQGTLEIAGNTFTVIQDPACSATTPDVIIHMSPSPAQQGQVVSFSSVPSDGRTPLPDGDSPLATDFRWDPQQPGIGETVEFDITGVGIIDQASWDFGASGCSLPRTITCTPLFTDCLKTAFIYATGGTHSVSLTVVVNGNTIGPLTKQITVLPIGSCSGGGGGSGNDDTWSWTVTMDGNEIAHSDQPSFGHHFTSPGIFTVSATMSNCAGTDSDTAELVVQPLPRVSFNAAGSYGDYSTPRCIVTFADDLLVGTEGPTSGGGLFRMQPGGAWSAVTTTGFGHPNNTSISALATFDGSVFAGTANAAEGAELWRSSNGLFWTVAMNGGFGDPLNAEVMALQVHGGDLYAAVRSVSGAEVWRTADGTVWAQVNADGFGSSENGIPGALASFDGQIYATVQNQWNAEVWRRVGGTTWEQVNADGFGNNSNQSAPSMTAHESALYVGTINNNSGTELWRSCDGTTWSQANTDGFGSPFDNDATETLVSHGGMLYAGTYNFSTGAEVWALKDGSTWYPWVPGGFGDQYNWSTAAATIVGEGLYVATENPFGFQVWEIDLPSAGSTVFADGFESGDTSAWSTSEPE